MLLKDGPGRAALECLRRATGLRMALASDFGGGVGSRSLASGEGMLLERLGVALLCADPDQAQTLARGRRARKFALAPERVVRAHSLTPATATAACCSARLSGALPPPVMDTAHATWGLLATGTLASRYSGRGIRVAMLDTGLDLEHPDLAADRIVSQSFVPGAAVDARTDHGTFCAGVLCGSRRPREVSRYGIACDAELFVARVLDDSATGLDGNVLAGIDWAVRNHCDVISMSFGSPVAVGESYAHVYEQAAARAVAAGSLLIAPAGNSSLRPEVIAPVEHPANCPSIVAVGAVDQSLAVAPFSNAGLNCDGGAVDVVAPGVAIFSAASRPTLYQTASGTSMATPFVAGIAALIAEADSGARGAALRASLLQLAVALPAAPPDVGAGLAQSPR